MDHLTLFSAKFEKGNAIDKLKSISESPIFHNLFLFALASGRFEIHPRLNVELVKSVFVCK